MPKFTWLRGLGPFGTFAANVLAFLTANWGVAVSAALAVYVAASSWATGIVNSPATHAAALTFLVLLWGYIGITFLIDRRGPRLVRVAPDYRFGLTFEGLIPAIDPLSDEGWFSVAVQLRNFSQAPIQYTVTQFDVRIGTRALPKPEKILTAYLARGAGRTSSPSKFSKDEMREFFGKRMKGTADMMVIYGHPEEKPVRRLRIRADLILHLPSADAGPTAWGTDIISEIDESIDVSTP
jgi:hypothetical protein